jgi:membrane associated rhomboid family serine protease
LIGIILVSSALFAVTQRSFGYGVEDLIFTVDGVLHLQLWRLVTFPFVETEPFGLIIGLVILYFFGRFFEAEWGSAYYARFFVLSSVGAALIAVPLSFLLQLAPFDEIGMGSGPDAAINAMLVAMAVTMPNSNILLGFVLPMRAKTAVYAFIGLELLFALMNGTAALSISLGGMAMGWVLVTGMWRPSRLMTRLRMWQLRRKRRGLYVVPPGNDKTLH